MRGNDVQEGLAHVRVKAKSAAASPEKMMIEENAAGAARLVAVRQEEVAVAPRLEARVVVRIVPVAGGAERGVEIGRVRHRLRRIEPHRRQVAAAAEPALRRHQHARVEMRGGHARASACAPPG